MLPLSARRLGNEQQAREPDRRGQDFQPEHPAPGMPVDTERLHPCRAGLAQLQHEVIGEIRDRKTDHDIELIERDEKSAALMGRDFGDIHGRDAE